MPKGIYAHKSGGPVQFWSGVSIREPNDCWPWSRYIRPNGYGEAAWKSDNVLAHRVAWELANGPIHGDLCVLHHCDNPPCCNPAHLFLGTRADNNEDKVRKGRDAAPEVIRAIMRVKAARCERNGRAKLTNAEVDEIRLGWLNWTGSMRAYCLETMNVFDVGEGCLYALLTNRRWKDLPWPMKS